MELFYILAAVALLLCGHLGCAAFGLWLGMRLQWERPVSSKREAEELPDNQTLRQFANLLSYDGTGRGQRSLEDE